MGYSLASTLSDVVVDANTLMCPSCGGQYLHQFQTETFWREEDATEGSHVCSTSEKTTRDSFQHNNPSVRRDGLLIRFWCESCNTEPELAILQHKGRTFIEWHSTRQRIKPPPSFPPKNLNLVKNGNEGDSNE